MNSPVVSAALAITTHRLTIRPVSRDDLADILEINGDDEVTAFLPYTTWQTPEDGINWLVRMEKLVAAETANQWVIVRRTDQKILGTVLLFNFNEASGRVELGYVLGRPHWQKGYAKEALAALCQHVFTHLGMRRIEAEVNTKNIASNSLLLRLGFLREGCLRQRWVAKGVAYDTHIYACLADEWLSARARLAAVAGAIEGSPMDLSVKTA